MENATRILLLLSFPFLGGCFSSIGSVAGSQGAKGLKINSHTINSTSERSASISLEFEGDSNSNSQTTFYFCSVQKDFGCNPLLGDSLSLTKASSNFSANINFDSYGYLSHDLIKYVTKTTDSDGVEGLEAKGYFVIGNDSSKIKKINQLGFNKDDISSIGSEYVTGVKQDGNGNIYLYGYTVSPLSEPSAGGSDMYIVKMSSQGVFDEGFGEKGVLHFGAVSFGEEGLLGDYLLDLQILSSGKLLLVGYTYSDMGEESAGALDVFAMRLNSDGSIDTSFNTNGIFQLGNVTMGSGASGLEYVRAACIDSVGGIYLVGSTKGSLEEAVNGAEDILVIKLTENGFLDASFDSNGVLHLGSTKLASGTSSDLANGCVIDANNKLVITGNTSSNLGETVGGSAYDAFVMRITSSGALDTSFSGDGIFQFGSVSAINSSLGLESANSISISNAGKIAIVGSTRSDFEENTGGTEDGFVAVFNDDGSLDTSFSGNGVLHFGDDSFGIAVNSLDSFSDVKFDSSGNLFVFGSSRSNFGESSAGVSDLVLVKIKPNGSLDTSFNTGGIFHFGATSSGALASGAEYPSEIFLKQDGGILLSAYTTSSIGVSNNGQYGALVLSLSSSGNFDTNLNSVGYLQVSKEGSKKRAELEEGRDLAVDSSGNTYVACHTKSDLGETNAGNHDICVVKYLENGNLDTSFANSGIFHLGVTTTPIGADTSNDDYVESIALDPAGGVYIVGYSLGSLGDTNAGGYDPIIIKLTSSGVLDTSFSGDGLWQYGSTTAVGGAPSSFEIVSEVAIDSNGKIVLVGQTGSSIEEAVQGIYDIFVMRLNPDGSFDNTFNGNGVFHAGAATLGANGNAIEYASDLLIDSSNSIYIGGSSQGNIGEANGGGYDVFIMKLSTNGVLDTSFNTDGIFHIGSVTGGAGTSAHDYLRDMAFVPSTGDIVVVGETFGSLGETSGGLFDAFIVMLDSSGSLNTSFNTTGIKQLGNTSIGANASQNDYFRTVVVSGTSIFALGETQGNLAGTNVSNEKDIMIYKFDLSGNFDTGFDSDGMIQLNKANLGTNTASHEYVHNAVISSSGNIHFSGYSEGSIGAVNGGNRDIIFGIIGADGSFD